ncbi:MAG TPA: hypothetical protein VI248_14680 [Kineosporiaceae bacterium]
MKISRGGRGSALVVTGVLMSVLPVGTAALTAGPAGAVAAVAGHSTTVAKVTRTPFPGKGPRAILNLSAAAAAKASTVHVRSRFTVGGGSGSSEWTAGVAAGTGVTHTIYGGTYRVIRVGSRANAT